MKEEHIKNLIDKYKAGKTSLAEEKTLFDDETIVDESIQKIATFRKRHQRKAPENFNESLWNNFEQKSNTSTTPKLRLLAVAASIALIVAIFIGNDTQNELTYSEKEALLNEAKSMFASSNETAAIYNVVAENDLLVVYSKSE